MVNPHPPAVRVIHCALSLNRRYEAFVRPRENAFICKHPEIKQITELDQLMASYRKPHAFAKQELDYNWEDWATMLREVVMFLVTIVQKTPTIPEEEALKQWAAQAHSQITRLNINGFAEAGFQYLAVICIRNVFGIFLWRGLPIREFRGGLTCLMCVRRCPHSYRTIAVQKTSAVNGSRVFRSAPRR